ncbi:hypothetical protein E2C01_001549 [Portunus trituberculatus]|uniref:Uncharacterized protein n=1 Tax=Portunus trituberculatus TaxID=210409 RepID=A0A5B7CJJ8_PORTR|nr:hypothetical protein [Portunus trituberculatus]
MPTSPPLRLPIRVRRSTVLYCPSGLLQVVPTVREQRTTGENAPVLQQGRTTSCCSKECQATHSQTKLMWGLK